MRKDQFVIDNSVFAKLFLEETGREDALMLIKYATRHDLTILAPDFFVSEFLSTVRAKEIDFNSAYGILEMQLKLGMKLINLNKLILEKALEISQMGHKKSGFPSVYDALYHGLAILNDCCFITADRKHQVKTRQLGHLILLEDWKTLFSVGLD